jgi:glucans biosynthesis protein C
MRRNEIDWLRNGAVLMLFFYHTAVVFDPFSDNYVKSSVHGCVAGGFILATFFWYMPLLFFLAGASAHFSLAKRSNGKFMKERVKRLLIPLLFGVLVIIPPQGYFAKLWRGIPTGGYLHHWGAFLTTFTDLSGNDGNFTPAHLWFILFLFVISALLLPLFRHFDHEKGQRFLAKIKPVMITPWGIVIAAVTLFIMRVIPDIGGKNIFYFGLIFVFGAVVYSDNDYIEKICAAKWRALIGLLIFCPLFLWSEYMMYEKYTMLWLKATEAMVSNIMMIFAIIVLIGFGTKYLSRGGKALSYLNEACFPVYIIHQTVLIAVAYYTLRLSLPIAVQAAIIIASTIVITFVLYEISKRIPPLRFLLGIKSPKTVNQTVSVR